MEVAAALQWQPLLLLPLERGLRNGDLTVLLSTCFLSSVIFRFRSPSPSKYLIAGFYQAEHLKNLAYAPTVRLLSAPNLLFSDTG